jgi:hypothetical protein
MRQVKSPFIWAVISVLLALAIVSVVLLAGQGEGDTTVPTGSSSVPTGSSSPFEDQGSPVE